MRQSGCYHEGGGIITTAHFATRWAQGLGFLGSDSRFWVSGKHFAFRVAGDREFRVVDVRVLS